jgi:DNA polymerase-3 subunit alpha
MKYVHLHNHSHYSLLDGACKIDDLVAAAMRHNMPALALTDHGNMFGAVEFYRKANKAGIKPIIGVEAYVAPEHRKKKSVSKGVSDTSYHLVLLAKNERGYKNLMKLVSLGYLEGFYYRPRLDKEILREYHEGIIALSACLKGEVAFKLGRDGYEVARQVALEYREIFGDDFYLEMQNHGIREEDEARKGLKELSRELSIPLVVTNDIHYLQQDHAMPHDVLLCIQTGKDRDDPNRLRYNTDQIYFKSAEEMAALFPDQSEALSLTYDIAEKCDIHFETGVFHLPNFEVPAEHGEISLDDYIQRLAVDGLRKRYDEVTPELEQRLQYELDVIKKMGYSGYFLIVMDFIDYARRQGIPVGPGRGSAAGSLVSYCLGITNVDPIKYDLIFERFLNPERVTMPDIDIDFCYERREEIIQYVKEKYGEQNVTQIITFGTMAARAVIRDVGRALKVPYSEVDRIAKLIPATPGTTLESALEDVPDLREAADSDEQHRQLIEYSLVLEGLARHASTHAAGVVITPEELTNYTPLYKSSDGAVTTQYDMKALEEIGVLKMDFLGLRTLTVIDKTVRAIRERGIEIDIDKLPLDDPETYGIFARGETVGIFQFESSGMREYLKKLKPQAIEDLIAMNALYRPGPMEMIDDFIERKHGRRPIKYLHPSLEPILRETYGVIVYQEQVMRIASELGGFSLGAADLLRRAMGKKKAELMAEQRVKFINGCAENGIPAETANAIFDLMDKFAGYGFNKSHAACYSLVAYQTAYLKAHYPAEFMAATLSSEMGSSNRVVVLIDECRRMGVPVLPPDVNESYADFIVSDGAIRFGLGAVKNVGRTAIDSIVKARQEGGRFKTLFDFCQRVDLRLVNKKVIESLIQAGAFDSVEGHRAQLMEAVDMAVSYAQSMQSARLHGQTTIFDLAAEDEVVSQHPPLPHVKRWSTTETLNREKALLGFYVSGHPLSKYEDDVRAIASVSLDRLDSLKDGQRVTVCGIVTACRQITDRQKRPMAFVTLEDFSGQVEILAFADPYSKYRDVLQPDQMIAVVGRTSTREEEETKILCDEVLPLEGLREKFAKALWVALPSPEVGAGTLDEVSKAVASNKGKCDLCISVRQNGDEFRFRSRRFKVNPTPELLVRLRELVGNENVWIEGKPVATQKGGRHGANP